MRTTTPWRCAMPKQIAQHCRDLPRHYDPSALGRSTGPGRRRPDPGLQTCHEHAEEAERERSSPFTIAAIALAKEERSFGVSSSNCCDLTAKPRNKVCPGEATCERRQHIIYTFHPSRINQST